MNLKQHKNLRLGGYDYAAVGCYFVTVVTEGRRELFGHIADGQLMLNCAGKMVEECIADMETRFKGLEVLNSVVMPNHVHAILLNEKEHSIPEVMRQFKAVTSRLYHKKMETDRWKEVDIRLWQRSYYDIIIKKQRMFDFINEYIATNPERWTHDKMNEEHTTDVDEIYKAINILR